ncbi:GFA family protein [Conexibacter woesei]|uniref:GFA family protein n=1 Tax=Conexibacter woesei TaxID=191495 RepID=UPI000424C989|nr:GFA family protein [Conexibacter woesei]
MTTHLTGACLCGGVRYEVTEPLADANYCHCTRCQRRTGTAASANARMRPGSFRVVAGEELIKAYDPGDGGFLKLFCVGCGSALYSEDPADPSVRAIRLGTVDGDPGIRPEKHQRVETAAVWEAIPDDGLPRYASPS